MVFVPYSGNYIKFFAVRYFYIFIRRVQIFCQINLNDVSALDIVIDTIGNYRIVKNYHVAVLSKVSV